MFPSKERKTKEEIRTAFIEGDLVKLIQIGFAKFMDLICGKGPLPFQKFLKYTGDYFDQYILDVSKQRHLNYVGGKMLMELEENRGDVPPTILICADFYFQSADKQWIMEKKKGQISADQFTDWESDTEAIKLQRSGRLELAIEPPRVGAK